MSKNPIDYRERFKTFLIASNIFKEELLDEVIDTISLKELQQQGSELNEFVEESLRMGKIISKEMNTDEDCDKCPDSDECRSSMKKDNKVNGKDIISKEDVTEEYMEKVLKISDPKYDGRA